MTKKVIPKVMPVKCPVCNGYGTLGTEEIECHACKGKGYLLVPAKEVEETENDG